MKPFEGITVIEFSTMIAQLSRVRGPLQRLQPKHEAQKTTHFEHQRSRGARGALR